MSYTKPIFRLFYKIKGKRTNLSSDISLQKLNIGFISDIDWSKRKFLFFNRDRPYRLHIEYTPKNSTLTTSINSFEQKRVKNNITYLYKTEKELTKDIFEITQQKKILNRAKNNIGYLYKSEKDLLRDIFQKQNLNKVKNEFKNKVKNKENNLREL